MHVCFSMVQSSKVSVSDSLAVWYLQVMASTVSVCLPIAPQLRISILQHSRFFKNIIISLFCTDTITISSSSLLPSWLPAWSTTVICCRETIMFEWCRLRNNYQRTLFASCIFSNANNYLLCRLADALSSQALFIKIQNSSTSRAITWVTTVTMSKLPGLFHIYSSINSIFT